MNLESNIAVQNASKAHKLKVKVKKICQQMDELKSNKVKTDVFFSVLKITNIKINKDVENELIEKYTSQGMIDYKDALSRIAINLEEDKPLNTNWVLRSAQSSMRSTIYSVQQSRIGGNKTPKTIAHSRVGSNNIKLPNELDLLNKSKLNFSGDQIIEQIPYNKDILNTIKNKTPLNSRLSHQRGRATPASNLPVKLINQQMKNKHENDFNIITNRDKNKNGLEINVEESDKMMSQAMADYQDFSKAGK